MDTESTSDEQKQRVQEIQSFLATGIEQLILYYVDMCSHGYALHIHSILSAMFAVSPKTNLGKWNRCLALGGFRGEYERPEYYCYRCKFALPWTLWVNSVRS